jgi:uncharacterized membrane protein YbhN (UPF0104 family)
MPVRAKQILKLLVKVAVAVLLLSWAFSKVHFTDFRQTLKAAQWQYLLGVWGSTALFSWMQAVALKLILKKQDCDVGLNTIFGATCITSMYSLVVPGVVSTGVKWYILKRTTGKGTNALSAMLYNQVTMTVVMMAVGLIGLIWMNPTQALWPEARSLWILPVVCGIVLAALLLVSVLALNQRTGRLVVRSFRAAFGPLVEGLAPHLGRWAGRRWLETVLKPLREKGRSVLTQLATFQTAGWRFHLTIASINVADGLLVGLLWYLFSAWAAVAVVPVRVLIWLCAIVFLLGKLQITVANLGVREWVLVSLLPAYGVTESTALLMSMILLSSQVFLAALGAAYQLLWALQSRQVARRDQR